MYIHIKKKKKSPLGFLLLGIVHWMNKKKKCNNYVHYFRVLSNFFIKLHALVC